MYLFQLVRRILIRIGLIKKHIVYTQVQESVDLSILKLDDVVKFIDCSSDGSFIACAISNQVRIYKSSLTILIATLVGHINDVNQVKIFKSSIIATCSDESVRVWNASNLRQLAILNEHRDKVRIIEFLSENTIIVVRESEAIVWNIHSDQQIIMIEDFIVDIKQLPNQQIMLHDLENCLKFWDQRTNKYIKSLSSDLSYSRSVVTSNNILRNGCYQKIISFLDQQSGKVIRTLLDDKQRTFEERVLHPSSEFIIICDTNKRISTWNLQTGMQDSCINYNHLDYVSAMTISRDGVFVFSAGFNSTIRRTSVKSLINQL